MSINLIRAYKKYKLNKLNGNWHQLPYVLSSKNLTAEYKNKYQSLTEVEHQIGRYLNMKIIADEILSSNYSGDIIEFGTWQGLGLILLNRLLHSEKRKFIGIDSFEGLPETSTVWKKGMFNNTSLNYVNENIVKYSASTYNQYKLIKGWFNDIDVSNTLYSICDDAILIHFDSDLGSSTSQALSIIEPYLSTRNKPIFFLFDDWGNHPDEVPDAFYEWVNRSKNTFKFKLTKLSSTRNTRYYKLDFPF